MTSNHTKNRTCFSQFLRFGHWDVSVCINVRQERALIHTNVKMYSILDDDNVVVNGPYLEHMGSRYTQCFLGALRISSVHDVIILMR